MSKIKKILAVLVTLAMVMAMSVTAFADDVIGNSDDTGTITVSGIDLESGSDIKVNAYKIVEAQYGNDGSFSGYNALYNGIVLTPDENGNVTIGQEVLNSIIPQIKPEDAIPLKDEDAEGTKDGSYTATVAVGSYLVMVTGAETKVYSPIVVSVSYKTQNGENIIDSGAVNTNLTIQNGNAWVKESGVPTIQKTVADGSNNVNDDDNTETTGKGVSVNVGDTVNYTVTIDPIPYYGGTNPKLVVNDKLDDGLTFGDTFNVSVVGTDNIVTPLTQNQDYTLSVSGQNLEINFVVEVKGNDDSVKDVYTLNDHEGKKVVITYSATLNKANAVVAEGSNDNAVTLTYAKDSKVAGATGTTKAVTHTYTFDITSNIRKIGVDNDINGLANAEFKLFRDKDCTDSNVYSNELTATDKIYKTNSEGRLSIKGLEAGTYYLKEVKAPGNYSVNTHVYKIDILADYNTSDGTLSSWTVKIDNTVVAKYTVTYNNGVPTASLSEGIDLDNDNTIDGEFRIPNTKVSTLPSTGGIGTTIFTVGGCLIMIAAAALFFVSRRKASNK